jgi:hypothetical protein
MNDETRDPVTGKTAVVVWCGEADRNETCFSLTGEINQARGAADQREQGATYDAVNIRARNWGPVRNGRLYE